MQSLHVAVLNPVFLGVFVGTAPVSAVLVGMGLLRWSVGCFGVTMVCNVPSNERLARVVADSAEGAAWWELYLRGWVMWNHVRTVCSLAAAGVLIHAVVAPA